MCWTAARNRRRYDEVLWKHHEGDCNLEFLHGPCCHSQAPKPCQRSIFLLYSKIPYGPCSASMTQATSLQPMLAHLLRMVLNHSTSSSGHSHRRHKTESTATLTAMLAAAAARPQAMPGPRASCREPRSWRATKPSRSSTSQRKTACRRQRGICTSHAAPAQGQAYLAILLGEASLQVQEYPRNAVPQVPHAKHLPTSGRHHDSLAHICALGGFPLP